MNDEYGGIFGNFGDHIISNEELDALEEGVGVGEDGKIHNRTEEFREHQNKLRDRQKMLLIERFIDELPEAKRFIVDRAVARVDKIFGSGSEKYWAAENREYWAAHRELFGRGEVPPTRAVAETIFRWTRDTTATVAAIAAGKVLYHAYLEHEIRHQESVERLGGPTRKEFQYRKIYGLKNAIEKKFDCLQDWLAKTVW